jgi:transcription elongation factor GreA
MSQTNGDETLLITADGYAERWRELEELRTEARRALGEHLREVRRDGDLDDNPALYDLFEEQAQLERRIAVLGSQLAVAEIVAPAGDGVAGIGSIVRVRDDSGPLESDIGNGRVSIEAPVGLALVGTRAGARVEVAAPQGALGLEVVSVRGHDAMACSVRKGRCASLRFGP